MKHQIFKGVVLMCLLSVAGLTLAGGAEHRKFTNTLIIKGGSTVLKNDTQNILGTSLLFDDKAPSYGVEWEMVKKNGVAYGLEYIGFTHDYTESGIQGEMSTNIIMFNAKKYLGKNAFRPFIGVGAGVSFVDVSGNVIGTAEGPALQLMAGFVYQTRNNIGIQAEVKWINAKNEDDFNTEIDSSGVSAFIGVRIPFNR